MNYVEAQLTFKGFIIQCQNPGKAIYPFMWWNFNSVML